MRLHVISTGSVGNAYMLGNQHEALLIECGVPILAIKKELLFDYSKVAGCLVTHSHNDHSKSINEVMALGIDVYASEDTFKKTVTQINHRQKEIEPLKMFMVGNFKVMAFEVKHDVPCVGFLIEHPECGKVLFLTDTYFCEYTFTGLNNIIIEANFCRNIIDRKFGADSGKEFLRNRILRSHFSLQNCKEMLQANDLTAVNNIVLIHLSDSNSNEAQFEREVSELTNKTVTVASKGTNINFCKHPF